MDQNRPLLVYFCPSKNAITLDYKWKKWWTGLRIQTRGGRMLGADEFTKPWGLPLVFTFYICPNLFNFSLVVTFSKTAIVLSSRRFS